MEKNIQVDRRKAFIAAFVFLLLLLLFFFLVSLKEPDPPLVEKEVEVELEIPAGGSSGGSSKAKNNVKKSHSAENLAVQKESNVEVNKGKGDAKKTTKKSDTESDWMSMGANGGNNGGQEGGDEWGSGGSEGGGVGPNNGGNEVRLRYGNPIDCIGDFNEEGKVYLIVWVNANGKIVRAQNNAAKSTTGSQNLISNAITAIKGCVSFEKRPGTPDQKIVLSKPVTFRKT